MPYVDRQGRTCGFMDFEEQDQSGRFFRRYFMIDQEKGIFAWYMDNPSNLQEGASTSGEIQLSLISNARDATKQRPKVEFCFVVTIPSRNYHFRADNQQDLEEWVLHLNEACKIKVPVPTATKTSPPLTVDITKANSLGSLSPKSPNKSLLSYKTEIVGGVVHRKAVENAHSDTDSEDESAVLRTRSWPRSPSPSSGGERNLSPVFPGKKVVKSGWCVKQGGVRKNWKRRYFILDDVGIAYYKSSSDKLPLKTITKKDITVCKMSDIGDTLGRDNLFEIISPSRTFFIQAYSPEDMAEWINAINDVRAPKRASAPQVSQKKSTKIESTCKPFCIRAKLLKTPVETEQTVKWEKQHGIKINIEQPPEDAIDFENNPVKPGGNEPGTEEDQEQMNIIMEFIEGRETNI
ncbi:pleckstrin homology domain-containing family A member 1-like isoform X2 [Asterias rubens]|uniref:pleckstrin homology domain-containing family A member 1-like isoform X2 n=1 Tax=Asterias rubens TaxID=7604 RepID=UPI001455AF12|nr:pleckstrin homology domain-containing family A member 1-like isoform X2 [Asterias rubens]